MVEIAGSDVEPFELLIVCGILLVNYEGGSMTRLTHGHVQLGEHVPFDGGIIRGARR